MNSLLSIDTETDNEDPMKANLKVVGIATSPKDAIYLLYPRDRDRIQDYLASPLPKVAHNIKYDYKVLVRHGFKINGDLEDTLILSQMNGELTSDNRELKTLVMDLFNIKHYSFNELMSKYNPNTKKNLWKLDSIPIEELGVKCMTDCKLTYKLYNYLIETSDQSVIRIYQEIEKPLLRVVLDMELKGVAIDIDAINKGIDKCNYTIKFCQDWLWDWCGEVFNLNPSLELERVLFDKMKLPVLKLCPNGRPRTDDTTLHRLEKMGYQEPKWLLRHRGANKLYKTYFRKYKKNEVNGRVYANFQQTGTDTGRFSSSSPNLQNVHPEALHVFTASEGNLLLSFDYKQMELVMLACLSKDISLCDAVVGQRDLHNETSDKLGIDRGTAKVLNFGIPYRMGAWSIMRNLKEVGIYKTIEECQTLLKKHVETFSGVEEYASKMIQFGLENGYIETITGRKRWIDQTVEKQHHFESQCVNTPIQGSCADIIKIAMINIAKYHYTPILQVHDELIFDVPLAEKDVVINIVTKCMENTISLPLPFKVEVSEGKTWADL